MKIWAHRGCCATYPENTLIAFKQALKYAIAGIELDIQLSKDGEMVVIHDETLDRTTDGTGYVKDYTLKELKERKIYAGETIFGEKYTTIPTIKEVFDLVKPYSEKYGTKINIELKTGKIRYEGIEEAIVELADAWQMDSYIVYSSFNPDSIARIKQLRPDAQVGILASKVSDCVEIAKNMPVDALHPNVDRMDVSAEELKRLNMPIRAWNGSEQFFPNKKNVDRFKRDVLATMGITDIFTNFPEWYVKER